MIVSCFEYEAQSFVFHPYLYIRRYEVIFVWNIADDKTGFYMRYFLFSFDLTGAKQV
jgi:hypothetical protein